MIQLRTNNILPSNRVHSLFQSICGGGAILHTSATHYFYLSIGLGTRSNNYAEVLLLKVFLPFAIEKSCSSLQFFGDLMLIISWIKRVHRCMITLLEPILNCVLNLISKFDSFSYSHIYREKKRDANLLSKKELQVVFGEVRIVEKDNDIFL